MVFTKTSSYPIDNKHKKYNFVAYWSNLRYL